jgi:hypothetical protein
MKATDEQVIEAWKKNRTYMGAGRDLNMDRDNVKTRVLSIRAKGIKLPEPLGRGKHIRNKATHDRPATEN